MMIDMHFIGDGVYHAGEGGIEKVGDFGYRISGDGQRELARYCPKFGVCLVRIHIGQPDSSTATFSWGGNVEQPTIIPSIGCDNPPRCGRHDSIARGRITA